MQSGVHKFIQDMAQIGFDLKVEAGLVIFQIIPVGGVSRWTPGRYRGRHRGTTTVAPGASPLDTSPRKDGFPKNQLPGLSKIRLADAQPRPEGLGRCPTCGLLVQPRPSGPGRGNCMTRRTTSVAMTAETEKGPA